MGKPKPNKKKMSQDEYLAYMAAHADDPEARKDAKKTADNRRNASTKRSSPRKGSRGKPRRSARDKSRSEKAHGESLRRRSQYGPRLRTGRDDSLDSYGQDRENLAIGSLLPKWLDSRARMICTTYAQKTYCHVRQARLDPTTQIAAYVGDSDGIGFIVDAASSAERIKDWVADQRTAYLEQIFNGLEFLHQLGMQLGLRQILKLATESDAGSYWTQESWDSFLNGLAARPLYVPAISMVLAKIFNRAYRLSHPDPQKDVPAALWVPWSPDYTLANARTMRDTLLSNTSRVLLHSEKAKLPVVAITRDTISELFTLIDYTGSNDDLAFFVNCPLEIDDGGVEYIVDQLHTAAASNGKFTKDMTDTYTNVLIHWDGERAADLWAICRLMHPYEATNNIMGMLQLDACANDTFGVYEWGQDSVAGIALDYPADIQDHLPALLLAYNAKNIGGANTCFQWNDNVNVAGKPLDSYFATFLLGPDSWSKSGVSFAAWRELEARALTSYLGTQTSKRSADW